MVTILTGVLCVIVLSLCIVVLSLLIVVVFFLVDIVSLCIVVALLFIDPDTRGHCLQQLSTLRPWCRQRLREVQNIVGHDLTPVCNARGMQTCCQTLQGLCCGRNSKE